MSLYYFLIPIISVRKLAIILLLLSWRGCVFFLLSLVSCQFDYDKPSGGFLCVSLAWGSLSNWYLDVLKTAHSVFVEYWFSHFLSLPFPKLSWYVTDLRSVSHLSLKLCMLPFLFFGNWPVFQLMNPVFCCLISGVGHPIG
jgi:hypothetical protein